MKRVIIAARLSRQVDGQTGVDSQDKLTKAWAEALGYEVVEVIADTKSGTVQPWNRPNLKPWVTDPHKLALYDAVVGFRLDRLTRGDNQSTNEIEEWARINQKELLTEDALRFPCEGADGIRWDITKRLAHEEWLKISERYSRMQKWLRDNNFLVGAVPYGYEPVMVPGTEHKTLGIVEDQAEAVRTIYQMLADGYPVTMICERLDKDALTMTNIRRARKGQELAPNKWGPATVTTMVRNPVYKGRRVDLQGRTQLEVPEIVTATQWKQANDKLDGSKNGRRGQKYGKKAEITSLLNGVIVCGYCGRNMWRVKCGSNKTPRLYYRCSGTPRDKSTCSLMVQMAQADLVMQATMGMVATEPHYETIVTDGFDYQDEIDDLTERLKALDYDAPDWRDEQEALINRRDELKAMPAQPRRVVKRPSGKTMGEWWLEAPTAERRQFLLDRGCVVKVTRDANRKPVLTIGWGDQWIPAGVQALIDAKTVEDMRAVLDGLPARWRPVAA